MIRVDTLWFSTRPLDMRAGMETILSQVVRIFGEANPHHAYLFANQRGNRLKVLVHDGYGIWLANRRLHLNQGRFQLRPGGGTVTPRPQPIRCTDSRLPLRDLIRMNVKLLR